MDGVGGGEPAGGGVAHDRARRSILQGYESFHGDLVTESDGTSGTFTISVESALARDLIGQTLHRAHEVDGDTLVPTPSDPADGFRATYERG